MVGEEVFDNATQVISAISPELASKLAPLMMIIKAVGIAFVIYVIYLLVSWLMKWKDRKRLKRIEEKLDILLRRAGKSKKSSKK